MKPTEQKRFDVLYEQHLRGLRAILNIATSSYYEDAAQFTGPHQLMGLKAEV
jgi:hypothetical protein